MPTKIQELIARLEADGWYQVRQKGSHRQFHHADKTGTVTVAGKSSVELTPGTLNSILKQAGLKK
jgi:predicted RNA binding protein YcfA (HicA-like mRNA interferase family)